MGSRTNSTQPLPRTKATSNSNAPSTAGPSQKRPKPKKPTKSVGSTKKFSSKMDRLTVLMLVILSTYALWICPSDTHLSSPVCRSLSQYRTHVLDPYVLSPVQRILSHPYVAPAIAKFHAVERVMTPIVVRTHTAAKPYITKAAKLTRTTAMTAYAKLVTPMNNKYLQPLYQKYVDPLYLQYVYPRVHLLRSRVLDPYLRPLFLKAHLYVNKAFWACHRLYQVVAPRIHIAYVRARPFIDRAWRAAKPHVMKAAELGLRLFNLILERSVEARRQFVDPHVIRIWEKVVELSGSSRTTASSTPFPGTSFLASSSVSEAKAASPEVESETVQTDVSSIPPVTKSATLSVISEPPETASAPDDSSLPVETMAFTLTLSSDSELETSTIDGVLSTSSTSSLAPSVSEAFGSFESILDSISTPSVAQPIETPLPEATEVEPQVELHNERETEFEVPFEAEEANIPPSEDDLDNFFADLGIVEVEESDVTEPSIAIVEEEQQGATLTPEEVAEARRVATAKKRAELEARMEKWHLDLDVSVKRGTKAFRKELVRIRKGAVRSLFPDPEKDNSDLEEALTHIRGEDVAGILGRFEKESEKLLKGLESYLKKEEKLVVDSSSANFDDRMKRWYNVVQRVEERFIERINGLHEKIHWWYLEVRELEVQEYHRATKEVKTFAQKAQGDMGMPMAWLDDVSYQDWQRYHDLIRAHERFDEQIRMIQNGTHPSPPIDPLVPALDKLQLELEDLKNGFDARVRTLNTQIHLMLSPPEKEEQKDVSFEEPEEEQVSILPIHPVPTSTSTIAEEQEFDPVNIILGKSKEQVEEALSIAQESVHEEL
ncbi:hypothetical protein J3R30DRAFT_3711968 [Lentinula aciculospora]|uniref:Uncharacterized protein n=1 Tax=Lentinula aciculospora TaxID=153920 RepID=A0A9W9A027_9AGAR|nr:hypothetical protein J3R30DRAFT_3711968 [Lentinula aciculospora]